MELVSCQNGLISTTWACHERALVEDTSPTMKTALSKVEKEKDALMRANDELNKKSRILDAKNKDWETATAALSKAETDSLGRRKETMNSPKGLYWKKELLLPTHCRRRKKRGSSRRPRWRRSLRGRCTKEEERCVAYREGFTSGEVFSSSDLDDEIRDVLVPRLSQIVTPSSLILLLIL
jgi:hypothetical protein